MAKAKIEPIEGGASNVATEAPVSEVALEIFPTPAPAAEEKSNKPDAFWEFGPGKRWPMLWPQVVVVAGGTSVGKTTFATDIGVPTSRIIVFDFEKSASQIDSQTPYGKYRDMQFEMTKKNGGKSFTNRDLTVLAMDEFSKLKVGEFDVAILDNSGPFESGLAMLVDAQPKEYGLTHNQLLGAPALKWGAVKDAYASELTMLAAKVKMVIITVRLRMQFNGNAPKKNRKLEPVFEPKGLDTLDQLASLAVWLKPEAGMIPSALVTKCRLGTRVYVEDPKNPPKARIGNSEYAIPAYLLEALYGEPGYVTIPHLPPRLPMATWPAIRYYMGHPTDYTNLKPDERAPMEDDMMTEDDRLYIQFATAAAQQAANEAKLALESMKGVEQQSHQSEVFNGSQNRTPKPEAEKTKTFPKTKDGLFSMAKYLGYPTGGAGSYGTILSNELGITQFEVSAWDAMVSVLQQKAPNQKTAKLITGHPYPSEEEKAAEQEPEKESA